MTIGDLTPGKRYGRKSAIKKDFEYTAMHIRTSLIGYLLKTTRVVLKDHICMCMWWTDLHTRSL